jgi:hypothetical protein
MQSLTHCCKFQATGEQARERERRIGRTESAPVPRGRRKLRRPADGMGFERPAGGRRVGDDSGEMIPRRAACRSPGPGSQVPIYFGLGSKNLLNQICSEKLQ